MGIGLTCTELFSPDALVLSQLALDQLEGTEIDTKRGRVAQCGGAQALEGTPEPVRLEGLPHAVCHCCVRSCSSNRVLEMIRHHVLYQV